MGKPLLGIHIIGGTSIPLGNPAGIVAAGCSVEYVRKLREMHPKAMLLVRWIEEWDLTKAPLWGASYWLMSHEKEIRALRDDPNLVFIGLNEPPDAQARQFATFERERILLLHDFQARAGVGAWSVGCPDLPIWPTYQPVLDAMNADDVVVLHEYGNSPDDVPSSPRDYDHMWHIGRFARPGVYEYLRGRRIVIAETGLDEVEKKGGPWLAQGLTPELYATYLLGLDAFYRQFLEIKAACVFTLGGWWPEFEASPVWPLIVTAQSKTGEAPPAMPTLSEMATSARWQVEEAVRCLENGLVVETLARLHGLIDLDDGLLYQLERRIHDQGL